MNTRDLLNTFPMFRLENTGGNCTAYVARVGDVELTLTSYNYEPTIPQDDDSMVCLSWTPDQESAVCVDVEEAERLIHAAQSER